jgi:hypothetical protein
MGKPLRQLTEEEKLRKAADFQRLIKELENSPVEMNSNLSQEVKKDLPATVIKTKEVTPVESARIAQIKRDTEMQRRKSLQTIGEEDYSKTVIPTPEKVYDAGEMKRQYELKKKEELAKALKNRGKMPKLGKLAATVVPGLGVAGALMAGSASDAMADAVIPGGVESLGEGSDLPMQDDTAQIKTYADSAMDPNLRRMALQELRNRGR